MNAVELSAVAVSLWFAPDVMRIAAARPGIAVTVNVTEGPLTVLRSEASTV